jgi:hypothetical protein
MTCKGRQREHKALRCLVCLEPMSIHNYLWWMTPYIVICRRCA